MKRAAIYARVSTFDQQPENQLAELRDYCTRREWVATEYVDQGVSGSKARRPALDRLMTDARRRKFDVLVIWALDRLGRSLSDLLRLVEELDALGLRLVSLREGIDLTTPAGRLQLHILAALAQFERSRLQERVRAGLQRAKAQGKRFGRPFARVPVDRLATVRELSDREAARQLGVARSTLQRWRQAARQNPPQPA